VLARNQTLACKVSTAKLQKSRAGGSRRFALLGLVSELGRYVRFTGSHFNGILTRITLDTFHQKDSSDDGSRKGELSVTPTTLHRHDQLEPPSRITSITLSDISFTLLDFPTLRHSFRNLIPTLRGLRLLRPIACPRTLSRFISAFSNLRDTTIHSPSWDESGAISGGSFGQCHGKLCISEFDDRSTPFLSFLESQSTSYEELTIKKCILEDIRPLQRFVSANGGDMRRLHIVVAEHGEHCSACLCVLL
jgi:hypothetical protein